ncbi:MAG: anthranilate phosphoribosyltransferase [Ignavibacteriales bacterium]|nr:anthranilate phosphoribosyltransferase [Ignavibacteriales bacterium]
MIRAAIAKLSQRKDLTKEEAHQSMNEIMEGGVSDVLIGGFLMGLSAKGETVEEITGCALSLRERAVRVTTKRKNVVDTCGTGGDGAGTFNISTAAAIIASAAGVPVAKHGNRAVSSSCGSADVLQALGIQIENPPERVSSILDDVGITFLYAPLLHKAMKHAAAVRKELGVRTLFNILGPLANPAGAKRQVLGVYRRELTEPLAQVLNALGSEHAMVLHGEGGLDEMSTLGVSHVSELKDGKITTYEIDAKDYGFRKAERHEFMGGDAAENAAIIMSILKGKDAAPTGISVYNAGAALLVGGNVSSLEEGVAMAWEAVRSGRAMKKFESWKQASWG